MYREQIIQQRKNLSILVVDDDPGMTETLRDIFELKGIDVQTAESGEQAISLAEKKSFHFVLMDIKMPGMNGVETMHALKKIQPRTQVALMTGYAVNDLIEQGLHTGACCIHQKPLDLKKIIAVVEKLAAEKMTFKRHEK